MTQKGNEDKFSFEDLEVYKKALIFVNIIYEITDKFPNFEMYSLMSQFRRAAISISLNIAEGSGCSKLEFKRYLNIAKGSIRECVALISLSRVRDYINQDQETRLRTHCVELSKMLSGLINYLK